VVKGEAVSAGLSASELRTDDALLSRSLSQDEDDR